MSIRFNHALLLGSTTFLSLSSISDVAFSQVDLPPVDVSAPSPIRRAPARPAPQPKQAARPATTAPAAPAAPAAGTLPVVTDQFATVTVVPNEEIRRSGASTLGDLLQNKPGITGSSFAPGASSRPVIRGPATLRYGSQSIGGVVSATNNRIPEALPCVPQLPTFGLPVKAPLAVT